MNTVQLYPQYSKTLELTEKHDKARFTTDGYLLLNSPLIAR